MLGLGCCIINLVHLFHIHLRLLVGSVMFSSMDHLVLLPPITTGGSQRHQEQHEADDERNKYIQSSVAGLLCGDGVPRDGLYVCARIEERRKRSYRNNQNITCTLAREYNILFHKYNLVLLL